MFGFTEAVDDLDLIRISVKAIQGLSNVAKMVVHLEKH